MSWGELTRLGVRCRPIVTWPQPFTKSRVRSPFKAAWSTTVEGLGRELRHLGAKQIALHIAVPEHKIVADGTRPYADARADHPGVILAFESRHGGMHFAVDTFTTYQDNLRAIVLTLENLRAIQRYGTVQRAQQYKGFRELPDHSAQPAMTTDEAARWMVSQLNTGNTRPDDLIRDPQFLRSAYRQLAARMHPDKPGGSHEVFLMLGEAKRVLEAHHQRTGLSP